MRRLVVVCLFVSCVLGACVVPTGGARAEGVVSSSSAPFVGAATGPFPQLVDVPTAAPTRPANPTSPPGPAAPTSPAPTSSKPSPVGAPVPRRAIDCTKARCIALTFDDGPSAHTARLLAILRKHDVRTTFFFLGAWARLHPETVREAAAAGHVIGTHSWDHPSFARISDAQVLDQVRRSSTYLQQLSGQPVDLLRPPYGAMRKPFVRTGKAVIMWNTDTKDYLHWQTPRPDLTVQAALAQARPGAILLIHDSHGPSVDAVEPIVTGLKARGYVFVTVPELLGGSYQPDVVYSHG